VDRPADLKGIVQQMHLRVRAGVGEDSDIEEVSRCWLGSSGSRRLRSNARDVCICFVPIFAIPRLTDEQLAQREGATIVYDNLPLPYILYVL